MPIGFYPDGEPYDGSDYDDRPSKAELAEESARTLWCPECEDYRKTKIIDEGIGLYEFWGSREVHHDYQEVCCECETSAHEMLESEDDEEETTIITEESCNTSTT